MRNFVLKTMQRLRKDERGVTLVEYGIAVVLAVVVGTGALITLADDVNANLGEASGAMVIPTGTGTGTGTDTGTGG